MNSKCRVCGKEIDFSDEVDFCWHCGSSIRGELEDDEVNPPSGKVLVVNVPKLPDISGYEIIQPGWMELLMIYWALTWRTFLIGIILGFAVFFVMKMVANHVGRFAFEAINFYLDVFVVIISSVVALKMVMGRGDGALLIAVYRKKYEDAEVR